MFLYLFDLITSGKLTFLRCDIIIDAFKHGFGKHNCNKTSNPRKQNGQMLKFFLSVYRRKFVAPYFCGKFSENLFSSDFKTCSFNFRNKNDFFGILNCAGRLK